MPRKTLQTLSIALVVLSLAVVIVAIIGPGSRGSRDTSGAQVDIVPGQRGTRQAVDDRGSSPAGRTQIGDAAAGQNARAAGASDDSPGSKTEPSAGDPAGTATGDDTATPTLALDASAQGASAAGATGAASGAAARQQEAAARAHGGNIIGGGYREGDEDPPEDARPGAVSVGGQVLRGEQPLEGARIALLSLERGNTRFVYSNASGFYILRGVNPGEYHLSLVTPASADNRRVLVIRANEDRMTEDFVIPPAPPVRGIVVNEANGERVANVSLEVWEGSNLRGHVTANREGEFVLFPLDPGSYTLHGKAEGFRPGEEAFTVPETGQPREVRMALDPAGQLRGVVIGPDGSPVGGATVGLFGSSVFNDPLAQIGLRTTDGAGRFSFTNPAADMAGTFRAGAYHTNFVGAYSEPLTQQSLQSEQEITIVLRAGGELTGRTVTEDGTPIEGVDVFVKEGFSSSGALFQRFARKYPAATTDGEGVFRLSAVEPGNAVIGFAAETFVPTERQIAVQEGSQNIGDIELEDASETKDGRIFGVVIDEAGNPMRDHFVYAKNVRTGEDRLTQTNSQGGFRFDDLPEGEYLLMTNGNALRGDIFMTMDQRYPWATPGDEKIYLIYDLAQTIRLRVEDSRGQPVRNFKVGVRVRNDGPTGFGGYQETFGLATERQIQSSAGTAVLQHLLAGIATITVASDTHGSREIAGRYIPVNGELDLGTVVLDSGASARGIVSAAETGHALEGVLVKADPPPGAAPDHPLRNLRYDTRTGAGGNFRLAGLPEGPFSITFSRAGRVTKQVDGFTAEAQQELPVGEVRLEAGATLEGIVRGPEGQPAGNVQITAGDTMFFSDGEGRFHTDILPAGGIDLRFFDMGGRYETRVLPVELQAGAVRQIEVTLEPKGG